MRTTYRLPPYCLAAASPPIALSIEARRSAPSREPLYLAKSLPWC
ncbi:hypothetical protein P186_0164 [Pyrobaculum ferrireducens]|uniref:Uncharacterized protein n=1 Tax=Pyrobaculum ferrireducens TaxID=1104324 RepID=G7VEK1_9CREN|nr:hypothetical protein P186_0164 [Pyrobaculum ferrireducens]